MKRDGSHWKLLPSGHLIPKLKSRMLLGALESPRAVRTETPINNDEAIRWVGPDLKSFPFVLGLRF